MSNTHIFRLISFFIVLILVVALPWWIAVALLVGLTIYFSFYLEVLFFGFLLDILYAGDLSFPLKWLTLSTSFLFIIMFIKTQLRK